MNYKGKMTEKEIANSSQIERTRKSDGETNSKSNNESSSINSIEELQPKRTRYHRHTPEQIQKLEAFFKECPHPNDRQKIELSDQLGMEPRQVKFWFQNKKTQVKAQHEHKEINKLRAENEMQRTEILRLKEALNNGSCIHCNVATPVKETSSFNENSHLRQEYIAKTVPNSMETPSSIYGGQSAGGRWSGVVELATSAMEELMMVAQLGEPLWVPSMEELMMEHNSFVLNEDEYLRAFSRVFRQRTNGFKYEASRDNVIVATSAENVVEILMNVEQWGNIFSGVVSRATNMQVISAGIGGTYNEAILEVNSEFHVPSPFVPTRKSNFLRYCKRHVDGVWAVVDVSNNLQMTPSVTCQRRPSGCLIQDISNGHSKVIWVEHVEVQEVIHNIYKPLITSGLAFGARRWVAILEGYCQRLVRTYSTGVPSENTNKSIAENLDGSRSMLKLAHRMLTRFCCGVNTSIVNTWRTLSGNGNQDTKFMTRTNVDDPSMPFGVLLTVATSLWLPILPKRVIEFLCNNNTRKEWDMLMNGGGVEEIVHIASGREEYNHVKLYEVKGADSSSSHVTILQETRIDPTASYIVYSPIDMVCANAVLGGEESSHVPLLTSGFAILPDGPIGRIQGRGISAQTETGGSLLTVSFQVLIDSTPNANISMGSVSVASNLMWSTVDKIKQGLNLRA